MRFTLRELFVAVTLCAMEAALVAAVRETPWLAIHAILLGYFLLAVPTIIIVVWFCKRRLLRASDAFALSTMALTYAFMLLIVAFPLLVLAAVIELMLTGGGR